MEKIILISGKDSVRSSLRLVSLVKEFRKNLYSIEKIDCESENFSKNQLLQMLSPGLFSETKCILVANFDQLDDKDKSFFERISAMLENLPKEISIIFYIQKDLSEIKSKIKTSFFSSLKKNAKEETFNILKPAEITQKLLDICKQFGIGCERRTAEKITEVSGEDYLNSVNNLKTLISYIGFKGTISENHLEMVSRRQVADPWGLTENFLSSKQAAFSALKKQLGAGYEPEHIWYLILEELSKMLIISNFRAAEEAGMNAWVFGKVKSRVQKLKNLDLMVEIGKKLDTNTKTTSFSALNALQDFLLKV